MENRQQSMSTTPTYPPPKNGLQGIMGISNNDSNTAVSMENTKRAQLYGFEEEYERSHERMSESFTSNNSSTHENSRSASGPCSRKPNLVSSLGRRIAAKTVRFDIPNGQNNVASLRKGSTGIGIGELYNNAIRDKENNRGLFKKEDLWDTNSYDEQFAPNAYDAVEPIYREEADETENDSEGTFWLASRRLACEPISEDISLVQASLSLFKRLIRYLLAWKILWWFFSWVLDYFWDIETLDDVLYYMEKLIAYLSA